MQGRFCYACFRQFSKQFHTYRANVVDFFKRKCYTEFDIMR